MRHFRRRESDSSPALRVWTLAYALAQAQFESGKEGNGGSARSIAKPDARSDADGISVVSLVRSST